jgi:hypothetical protein
VDRLFREAIEAEGKTATASPTEDLNENDLAEAREFAAAYRREASLRFLNGRVKVGSHEYTRPEFEGQVERASQLNLL